MKEKSKFGFSLLDIVLVVLAVACIVSVLFRDQLQSFFGREEGTEIEYTFLVENVMNGTNNAPQKGEEILFLEEKVSFGEIIAVSEAKRQYQGEEDEEDVVQVSTLTCRGSVSTRKTERGYMVGEVCIKPGARFQVETETARFTMTVTMVKETEK